jgi:hypothetical protein
MDQVTMVSVNLAGGWRLIDALEGRGFKVDAAFWAKLSDEEKWNLYIASPYVDQHGPGEAYRRIHAILRDAPEWGIDAFTVTALGAGNSMAEAAAALMKPKATNGSSPKASRVIWRFPGGFLGKFHVDAAFIYPPWEPGLNPVD